MKKSIGIIAALLSAFIFGFTPILAKLSYEGGNNSVNLTFLRSTIAIPFLYLILKKLNISLAVTKRQLIELIFVGVCGMSVTTMLFYTSFEYLPIGMATMLHFFYPLIVSVISAVVFKMRVDFSLVVSFVILIIGFGFFITEYSFVSWKGVVLALFSSITYAFYVLGVAHTSLKTFHFLKLTFYFSVISCVATGILGTFSGALTLQLTFASGVYTFLISMLVSIGAISLFQIGVQTVGASAAAILSTLEPITGVICGVLFFNESLSWKIVTGSILITFAVIITALSKMNTGEQNID